MIHKKNFFVVWTNTDLTEGKGKRVPLYFCETEATAKRLAKGKYVQGSDCPTETIELIIHNTKWCGPVVIEKATDADEAAQKDLDEYNESVDKARAAGLTWAEIKILGTRML